ncbi:ChrR family anti-sigma-E factor [Actibacterium lipolyticum]|uniref:Anti-sigma-E factor ChrR n=1 Tax=Actibacterium lipolyticum TaxID=1524263 RepID=A0A238KRK4_9RHOB|nr:ChrR family anti-sigma-E factor [Actibacterium lipolyticum]SMX44752.1 Anti-sigma-E factor ChrR [Actibacterium lipolyticum]
MSDIKHHIPENLIAAYASGALGHHFALVVATHVSMCTQCRAALAAHETIGGLVLEDLDAQPVSMGVKSNLMAQLDAPIEVEPAPKRMGAYPGPVMGALGGDVPKWRSLGFGSKQSILHNDATGSVRLLFIPPGQAMPDHGHNGLELTLVLQGSFHDEDGAFGVGDVEVADEDVEHTPIAGNGPPCICLAATDAPLRFSGLVPRILQPLFRI